MPTYGYECQTCKEQFETFQRITEEPLQIHDGCGGELRRLLYPVGIVFKGPGFYVNDYARRGKTDAAEKPVEKSAESASPSKAEAKTEANGDTKADAGSEKTTKTGSEAVSK